LLAIVSVFGTGRECQQMDGEVLRPVVHVLWAYAPPECFLTHLRT
jgi:hypothetical protein